MHALLSSWCSRLAIGPARKVAVVVTLCAGIFLPGADCVPRECSSNANCVRVCECTDTQLNQTFQCPLTYLCGEGTCEDQITESCDDMCGRIAARGLCGTQRCVDERDCDRSLTCGNFDANGNLLSQYQCERRFACDIDIGVCELDYTLLSDNQICQQCANGG